MLTDGLGLLGGGLISMCFGEQAYEVMIVAAMILGLATFGHIGVMFPLLARAIGVFGSIVSTYTVRAKAETKGIAIGLAVIAAVSRFASFIGVIAKGSEEKIGLLSGQMDLYARIAGDLTVANPMVLIGLLIGGSVPFLFSSMPNRAVGLAAYLIVRECRG